MRGLILRKSGFYLRETDMSTRPWSDKPERLLDNGEWLFEWTETLDEVKDGVTLGDIFAILAKLDKGERALFSALAETADITAFIEEAQKPLTDQNRRWAEGNGIDIIEVYRFAEITWYKREGTPDYEDNVISCGRRGDHPRAYALDFTPVNELLHCKIRLSPTMRFYDNRNDYDEKGEFQCAPHNPPFDKQDDPNAYPTINGKFCTCAQCEGERFSTSYKLGEFFWGLLDDICFHGAPALRDERLGTLLKTVEEVKAEGFEVDKDEKN